MHCTFSELNWLFTERQLIRHTCCYNMQFRWIHIHKLSSAIHVLYFREQMKLFMDYQEKCNRFYMQVVSQLCFEKSSPPSESVMKHLLNLVMHKKTIPQLNTTIIRTKKMTIFETVVDITPVFRSFLLQFLIRAK